MDNQNAALSVEDGYSMWAKYYDEQKNPLIALEEPITMNLIGDVHGKRILDLGCGTGRYALALAKLGAQVTGVDLSQQMIDIAKEKVAPGMNVQFMVADMAEAIDLPASSYDVIVSALAMCHLPDVKGFFYNIARLLVNDGFAVISDQNPYLIKIAKVRTLFKGPDGYHYIEDYPHLFSELYPLVTSNDLVFEKVEEPSWNMSYPDLGDIRPIPAALVMKLRKKKRCQ